MQITISGEDSKSINEVRALAKRLGLSVEETTKNASVCKEEKRRSKNEELLQLLKEAGSTGGLFQTIEDPVAWQREQRKDRVLFGREEK